MNQMLKSVHPVLGASDVNISCRFYEGLGFATVFRDDPAEPKYAALVRDGVEIHLQWASKEQFANSMDRPTYRFFVEDVDALYAELQSMGAITEATTGQGRGERRATRPGALVSSTFMTLTGTACTSIVPSEPRVNFRSYAV